MPAANNAETSESAVSGGPPRLLIPFLDPNTNEAEERCRKGQETLTIGVDPMYMGKASVE